MSTWTQTHYSLSLAKTRVDDYLSGLDTLDLIGILNDEAGTNYELGDDAECINDNNDGRSLTFSQFEDEAYMLTENFDDHTYGSIFCQLEGGDDWYFEVDHEGNDLPVIAILNKYYHEDYI
jgi:hypothetical protein